MEMGLDPDLLAASLAISSLTCTLLDDNKVFKVSNSRGDTLYSAVNEPYCVA